jgi:hypothetical protein
LVEREEGREEERRAAGCWCPGGGAEQRNKAEECLVGDGGCG